MYDFVFAVLLHLVCGGLIYKLVEPVLKGLPNGWRIFVFAITVTFCMEIVKFIAIFLVLGWLIEIATLFVGRERIKEWLDETPE